MKEGCFMLQEIINQLTPHIIEGCVVLITVLGGVLTNKLVSLIKTKEKLIIANTTEKDREDIYTVAKMIWNRIEEKWRITENVEGLVESKSEMFDKLLLEKFPSLTKEEIITIRQSIAGEFNRGKEAVLNESSIVKENIALTNKLKDKDNEIAELTAKLESIQNVVR